MEILQNFIQQTYNDLSRLDKNILQLQKGANSYEVIHSMYRIVHIICGTAGLYGLRGIESISAPVEKILLQATESPTNNIEAIVTEYRNSMDVLLSSLLSTGDEDENTVKNFQTSIEAQDFNQKLSSPNSIETKPIFEKSDIKPTKSLSIEESFDSAAILAIEIAEKLSYYSKEGSSWNSFDSIDSLKQSSNSLLKVFSESKREINGFSIENSLILHSNPINVAISLNSVKIIYSFLDKADAKSKISGDYFTEKFPWAFLESILEVEITQNSHLFGIILENNRKKLGLLTSFFPDTEILPISKQKLASTSTVWFHYEASLSNGQTVYSIDIEKLVKKFGKTPIFVESENENLVVQGTDVLLFLTTFGLLVGIPLQEVKKIQPYSNQTEIENSGAIKIFTLDELQGSNKIPEDMDDYRCLITFKDEKNPIGVLAGKILGVNSESLQISEEPFLQVSIEELDVQGKAQTCFGLATILSKK